MKKEKTIYSIYIFVLILLIGICSLFVYYFYNLTVDNKSMSSLITNGSKSVSSNVTLLDNNYYDNNVLSGTYVTNLINSINNKFSFVTTFDGNVTGSYSYYIVGTLYSDLVNTNENVLTKEIFRSDEEKYTVEGNLIDLKNSFSVNYQDVKKIYDDFKSTYGLETIGHVEYKVYFKYNVYCNKINKNVEYDDDLLVSIPLGSDTAKVSVSNPVSQDTKKYYSDLNDNYDMTSMVILGEFSGAIVLFILIIIILIKSIHDLENNYDKKLRKILSKYSKRIVNVSELPDLSNSHILFVKSFRDLLEASNRMKCPINYNEVISGKESVFIIFNNNQSYVYKLSLKKEK